MTLDKAVLENLAGLRDDASKHYLPGKPKLELAVEAYRDEHRFDEASANRVHDKLPMANGVVCLRTGKLEAGRPEDLLTSAVPVAFDPEATCPTFDAFLASCHPDPEVQAYLWRLVAYSLTGETTEQQLYLHVGPGANGKTVFLNILRAVAGGAATGMACQAPVDLILERRHKDHPTEYMQLRGKRIVLMTEPPNGSRLCEAQVKALTGGDEIAARLMHRDYVNFRPTAKFHLATNYYPAIHDDDEGIWRRIVVIPWAQSFRGRASDPLMEEKCLAELPGILARAVREAVAFYGGRDRTHSIQKPAAVIEATRKYREREDPLREFMNEVVEASPGARAKVTGLWKRYLAWSRNVGEEVFRQRRTFLKALERRGFVVEGDFVLGIQLRGVSDGPHLVGVGPARGKRSG